MKRRNLLAGIGSTMALGLSGCASQQNTTPKEEQKKNELIVSAHVDQFRHHPNSVEADIHLTNFSDVTGPVTIHIHYYVDDTLMHSHERAVRIEAYDLKIVQDVLIQDYHDRINRVRAHVEHVHA